jgi:hypothetical protein
MSRDDIIWDFNMVAKSQWQMSITLVWLGEIMD